MKQYSFNTAYAHSVDFYGTEMNQIDFENIALSGWDKIGNTRHRLYKYIVQPTQEEDGSYYVDLPCNADIIEAVTAMYEDYQKTTSTTMSNNNQSAWGEGYIEGRKFNTNHLYSSGKFIKYIREGQKLYLADQFDEVKILYKGILADDDGLPYLNEKEVDAIAVFIAYVDLFKKALKTKDSSTFQLSKELEAMWKLKCTQARVPDYINQNEMDEILNVSTSWDRKRYGKSYKPIR